MNRPRPINLNLLTIRFPLPAIVSILHRVSGVVLFLSIPLVLWGLSLTLTPDGFDAFQDAYDSFFVKFFLWLMLVPFCYHLIAGIRHLLMDIHIGDTLKAGRASARYVILAAILLIILAGVWLW